MLLFCLGLLAAPAAPVSAAAPASVVAPASVAAPVKAPLLLAAPPAGGIILAGVIPRAELKSVVAGGPQRFIAGLRVAPEMEKGRFRGFRLVQVLESSPLAGSANVRVGDVVVSVNGKPLERPDQFMRAWAGLAAADRIDVRLVRGGERLDLRWTIGG